MFSIKPWPPCILWGQALLSPANPGCGSAQELGCKNAQRCFERLHDSFLVLEGSLLAPEYFLLPQSAGEEQNEVLVNWIMKSCRKEFDSCYMIKTFL